MRGDNNTLSVIARRERSEGRGNPSCLGERVRVFSSDLNLENGFLDLILRKAQQIEFTLYPVDKNKQNF